MSLLLIMLAIVLVGRGVLQTFTRDLWWRWVCYRYQMVGIAPVRTAAWDRWTTGAGTASLLAGVVLFVFFAQ